MSEDNKVLSFATGKNNARIKKLAFSTVKTKDQKIRDALKTYGSGIGAAMRTQVEKIDLEEKESEES